ncbi:hypothetical protein F0A17_18010 [Billgrantia pellis]|uniref:Peptidase C-terminal archaeal/bacterial domain-containing protein n=1 Tax=Billgrantia pellis TaxID=2606936 RepID=A0A7V7FY97_9GAMM|nr:hypothetical protein [Halomonas pellis]KAA0010357.1 hypothetical protein F0A17_18010 [Halomonas pellis]
MSRFVSSLLALLLLTGCSSVGDLRDRAQVLIPGQSYQVLTAGQRYFTFTLEAPARVVLESLTFPGDEGVVSPAGQLLDVDGQIVARDWTSGEGSNFRIERDLEAGTWYLRVTTPHAGPSAYGAMGRDYPYRVLLTLENEN